MTITSASRISPIPAAGGVRRACESLLRDIEKTCRPGAHEGADVVLVREALPEEQYRICAREGRVEIAAGDELGLIYGLYRLSRDILGVQPFARAAGLVFFVSLDKRAFRGRVKGSPFIFSKSRALTAQSSARDEAGRPPCATSTAPSAASPAAAASFQAPARSARPARR